jgi:high-affinity nickel-transport protein
MSEAHPPAGLSHRIAGAGLLLIGANAGAWIWAWVAFGGHPLLLGTAFLAYVFGLRHAVDADHIAAIDTVTRKLMQDGRRPVGVGLFFSLGHSSVVVLLSAAVAAASAALKGRLGAIAGIGELFGTCVSAAFLLALAGANLAIFLSVLRTFRRVRRGGAYAEEEVDRLLARRGLLGRLFASLFRLIRQSWQMYPVGFLFGLGFDTATEVALLGISAREATAGIPATSILVFPALFTAGMALVDTADGILMLGAYQWAFDRPLRKLYYNLAVTLASVLVALGVGLFEILGLVGDRLHPAGPAWGAVAAVNDHFAAVGLGVIGLFALLWIGSRALPRARRAVAAKGGSA